jgi:hypothetical protein
MPRTNRDDGTPAAPANKRKLTDRFLARVQPDDRTFLVWDTFQRGLALQVRPTGHKAWKCIYALRGRPRWYSLGNADAIDLDGARKLAQRIMFKVAEGKDPAAEKKAERSSGTFGDSSSSLIVPFMPSNNRSFGWRGS